MLRINATALVFSLISGCATGEFDPSQLPAGVTLPPGEVVLGVLAQVEAGRTVQAVVNPYTEADVDHVEVDLYREVDGSMLRVASQATPAGSGVGKTVNFGHLKMNTAYKVLVRCIGGAGTSLNKDDGSGQAAVKTSNDDYVPVTVRVNLADKVFDGTMHPVVSVTNGTVLDTSAAESASVADNK